MKNRPSEDASLALLAEINLDQPQLTKIVQYLADGADINYQSEEDGYSALMLAVDKDHEEMVTYLLEQGASPLVENHHHEIASHLALSHSPIYQILKNYELLFLTRRNDIVGVKAVLASGANINFQGKDGYTAILIAVEEDLLEMVELLLVKGADIDLELSDGKDVFDLLTRDIMWETIRRERPLPEEEVQTLWRVDYEGWERARKPSINSNSEPFRLTQLKIRPTDSQFSSPPSMQQIAEVEQHFGHPLPITLIEIFMHYNGGRPTLRHYNDNEDRSISFFCALDKNVNRCDNIWWSINSFSEYLGPETLPIAQDPFGGVFYLKWVDGKAQVWLFHYGGDLVLDDDEDDDGEDKLPTAFYLVSDSLDELLEALYE